MKTKTAALILIFIMFAILTLHLSVLAQILPPDLIWGGRLGSDTDIYIFESISVLVILYFILITATKGSLISLTLSSKVVNSSLWVFLIIFILNTIGNMISKTFFERSLALLTTAISFLTWTLLRNNNNTK